MGWLLLIASIASVWYFDLSPIAGKETVYSRVCYEDVDNSCTKDSDYIYMTNVYRASFDGQVVINVAGSMPAVKLHDCTVLDAENWNCNDRFMRGGELVYKNGLLESTGLPSPTVIPKHQWFSQGG